MPGQTAPLPEQPDDLRPGRGRKRARVCNELPFGLPFVPPEDSLTVRSQEDDALPVVMSQLPDEVGRPSGCSAEGSGCSAEGSGQRAPALATALVNRDWQTRASQVEQGVCRWAMQHPPEWAQALQALFGANLASRRLEIGTDCEGMGAPLEALRVLRALGIIGGYCHRMSCEIDDVARQWFLSNHEWPDLVFSDILQRSWPQGVSFDLLSESDQHLPIDLDLYICGFPCCPFSMRKGRSKCFEEEKARPFFAVVDYIHHGRPKAFILENVAGLERRIVPAGDLALHADEQITCLEHVLRTVRRACPDYFICVVPPSATCPSALGYKIRRPREYILGGRCDMYAFPSEARFAEQILHNVRQVSDTLTLSAVGSDEVFPPSAVGSDCQPHLHHMAGGCACSWSTVCPLHFCNCQVCSRSGRQLLSCAWRARHKQVWATLGREWRNYSYFAELLQSTGIHADGIVATPRARDLLNLVVAEAGGLASCRLGVLDLSQSHGWHQWRNDGCIPTLATGSQIFLVAQGRFLPSVELRRMMGFPPGLHDSDCSRSGATRLLGNTMHVCTVGVAIGVLIAARSA